jgi:hypothetical protein
MVSDEPTCPKCNGEKWTYSSQGEEVISIPCVCLERARLRSFLGETIFKAKHLRSELYTKERDATKENLFIKGTWSMACSHFRWVFSAKRAYSSGFNYRIVDDDKLIRTWLGAYAYKNRSKAERDNRETWNTLEDLIGDPKLVVIKLGVVRRNKAAGDVLLEALKTREDKPTWIFEGDEPFGPGHNAYNAEVFSYVSENFTNYNVGGDVESERRKQAILREAAETLLGSGGVDSDSMPDPKYIDNDPVISSYEDDGSGVGDDLFDDGPLAEKKKKWGKW